MGISARQIAFQALISVEIDRSYSNIVLNNLLTDFDVDIIAIPKPLITLGISR